MGKGPIASDREVHCYRPLPTRTTFRQRASNADGRAPRGRPRLAEREEERDGEHNDTERRADYCWQLRAGVPLCSGMREFQVACRWEDEGECGCRCSAGYLEHNAEVACDERNWYWSHDER